MYPQHGGWPAPPAPPKKPSRAPLLLIPLVFGAVCVVGMIASRGQGEQEQSEGPAPTLPPVVAPPTNPPAPPSAVAPSASPQLPLSFVSQRSCSDAGEWTAQLRTALNANVSVLTCLLPSGVESLRIPIGRDGVRGPTALARIYHHLLVNRSSGARRPMLAEFRNLLSGGAPVETALSQPEQVQRMNAVFEATVASSGPVSGMNVYRFALADGRTVLGLDSNPGSPLYFTGQRVRVYGVWGVKDGGAVVFPFWFEER